MGNADSKQKLGERVMSSRRKLEQDKKMQAERSEFFKTKSPQTMKVMMDSIDAAFQSCSPFLEPVLLCAWQYDPKECENIILNSCEKVLKAPIIKTEYEWFKKYVFPSSVWMFETKPNHYMYEELLSIANNMSQDIITSMDSIYEHLKYHSKWKQLTNIKNVTIVSRQDDEKVGLLKEKGITDITEIKDDKVDDMQTFIDSNVAVNKLVTTAKNINNEFQNHIKTVMSRYGDVASGPVKVVGRCQSKLENDYQDAKFPKSAKLLDLVRCSVTFNTLHQLIDGYNGLITHIQQNPSMIELARVKNGFLHADQGGYRDIKLNVIYKSQIDVNVNMICEIQLLFGQYLHEKKRIHKLYNVLRQNEYFKMVVHVIDDNEQKKELKDLKLIPVLDVSKEVKINETPFNTDVIRRCCMDYESPLLAIEGQKWNGCIDTNQKELIFKQKSELLNYGRHTSNWILINGEKYLSIKTAKNTIKMFKVQKNDNESYSFEEDEKFGINLSGEENIMFCEFDRDFKNVIIVKNGNILEKRSVNNISVVNKSIKLKEEVEESGFKQLSLSNDGNFCSLAGGGGKRYWYFIDIQNDKQIKLESDTLRRGTYAPSFINGEPEFVVIGGWGIITIWDVGKGKVVKSINIGEQNLVQGTTSTNNILAVCTYDKMLTLYDTTNWEIFYSHQFKMDPYSIHLTSDSKYLTIGGKGGEKCIVLQIQ